MTRLILHRKFKIESYLYQICKGLVTQMAALLSQMRTLWLELRPCARIEACRYRPRATVRCLVQVIAGTPLRYLGIDTAVARPVRDDPHPSAGVLSCVTR